MTKLADEVLTVRVPTDIKRYLRKLAAEEHRTISNLVEVQLVQAIAARQPGCHINNFECWLKRSRAINDEVLTVRVPPALKRELRKLAAEDRRTVSNLVEVLLAQALQARQSQGQAA